MQHVLEKQPISYQEIFLDSLCLSAFKLREHYQRRLICEKGGTPLKEDILFLN